MYNNHHNNNNNHSCGQKGFGQKRFPEPLMLVVLLVVLLSKHTHFGVLRSPLTLPSDSDGLFCVSSGTSTVSLLTKNIR